MRNIELNTEINCEPQKVIINLDSEDDEPFLDGVWDENGKELVLCEADEERVLYDARVWIAGERSDWAAHIADDCIGS